MSRVPMASDFHYLIGEDGFVPVGHFFLPFNIYLEDTAWPLRRRPTHGTKQRKRVMAKQAAEATVVVLSTDSPERTRSSGRSSALRTGGACF